MASMTKRESKSSQVSSDLSTLLQCLTAMLVTARLLIPTEGSVLGDTLWLTPLWFLTAALWAWDSFRRRDFRVSVDRVDLAVWLVVLGHILSALFVFATEGDQRAVLNMTWEWLALGVSFGLIRQTLRSTADSRSWISAGLCLAVALSVYGLWQHYVEFPANVLRVESLETELAELGSVPSNRGAEIRRELRAMGVPQDGPAKRLWSDRLRSTEPFATFALTNTFAGFLAGWWVIGMIWWWQARRQQRAWFVLFVSLGLLLVVGYCLILTKSRTAWVGLLAGSAFAFVMSFRKRSPQLGRWLIWGGGAVCIAGLLFAVATLSGGFDREVLSEAPKSLSYRLEYWQGTAGVIQDAPLFGTGPGNFRSAYLRHKLPGASEEIADPHNFVLDLWVCGGLLAVAGAIWLGWLTVRRFTINAGLGSDSVNEASEDESRWSKIDTGVVLGHLLVIGHRFLFLAQLDVRSIWLAIGWLIARGLWFSFDRQSTPIPRLAIAAALVTMLVHLLGAGGIEMPAIGQMLLLLIAIAIGPYTPKETSPIGIGIIGGTGIALAAGCVLTSTLPVLQREAGVAGGDFAWLENQNYAAAMRFYEQAAESDPHSAEPCMRLADLSFQRWQSSGQDDEQYFWSAIEAGQQAIERNPTNASTYRSVGNYFLKRHSVSHDKTDADHAVEYLAEAVQRYPTLPAIQAEYALALHAADDGAAAQAAAQKALTLDELYKQDGHIDKLLSESRRTEMERLVERKPGSELQAD